MRMTTSVQEPLLWERRDLLCHGSSIQDERDDESHLVLVSKTEFSFFVFLKISRDLHPPHLPGGSFVLRIDLPPGQGGPICI